MPVTSRGTGGDGSQVMCSKFVNLASIGFTISAWTLVDGWISVTASTLHKERRYNNSQRFPYGYLWELGLITTTEKYPS